MKNIIFIVCAIVLAIGVITGDLNNVFDSDGYPEQVAQTMRTLAAADLPK